MMAMIDYISFTRMNKLRISFLVFVHLAFFTLLEGQTGPCFRFTDTLYMKANVLHIWHATCVCPSLCCVVRNETEKEIALSLFSGESLYSEESMPPLLTHQISNRRFGLMRNYSEDSLSNRFTWKEIRHSLEDELHIDTMVRIDNFYQEAANERANSDRGGEFYDSIRHIVIEWTDRIMLNVSEEDVCIGNLHFQGNGNLNPHPYDDAPTDTIECNGELYCLKMSPFESWGILAEVQNECNFFNDDTAERDLLQYRKFKKILLFLPLEEKNTVR